MYRVADVEKAEASGTWLQPPRLDDEDVPLLKSAEQAHRGVREHASCGKGLKTCRGMND